MNWNAITLRDLEYLVTVAELGHLRKAAEKCGVSQPALSMQIKKIESLLGLQIFERNNRNVTLSDEGSIVCTQAQKILDEAQLLEDLANKQKTPLSSELRLGAIATVGPYFIPHFLAPMRKKFPLLKLTVREGTTDFLLEELNAGKLDAVILATTFDQKGFDVFNLYFEPFFFAAPKGHKLLQQKKIETHDLKPEDMVLLEEGHCLKDQILEVCAANVRGKIKQTHATSLQTLKHLVASGSGYTVIPALAVDDDKRLESLIEYRNFKNSAGRTITLACRNTFTRKNEIALFSEFLRKHLPHGVETVEP